MSLRSTVRVGLLAGLLVLAAVWPVPQLIARSF
jgi:hypothetical protein